MLLRFIAASCFTAASCWRKPIIRRPGRLSARKSYRAKSPGKAMPSSEQVAQLEEAVRNNPDDLSAHQRLASYYRMTRQGPQFVQEVLWLINNHPESADVSMFVGNTPNSFTTPADYALVKAAWESALATQPTNARAEYNAAGFFQSSDINRALELFSQARSLDPHNVSFAEAEARIYRKAIQPDVPDLKQLQTLSEEQASALENALRGSSDALLVGLVGERLAMQIRPPQACPESCKAGNEALENIAWQLLQQAMNLQPDNPRWQQAMNLSKKLASGQIALSASPVGPQRIGGAVMEANLIKKVQPVYPPLAQSARVQGTVEFTATIDETGHVVNLQLVRGHPLLVNAAKEAALQWTYRPTLLNGQPVAVITTLDIDFTLPAVPANPSQPPRQ